MKIMIWVAVGAVCCVVTAAAASLLSWETAAERASAVAYGGICLLTLANISVSMKRKRRGEGG